MISWFRHMVIQSSYRSDEKFDGVRQSPFLWHFMLTSEILVYKAGLANWRDDLSFSIPGIKIMRDMSWRMRGGLEGMWIGRWE